MADIRVTREIRTRTTKAQRLMQVEPPAMVNAAITQQRQVDDREHDLQDADVEEVR